MIFGAWGVHKTDENIRHLVFLKKATCSVFDHHPADVVCPSTLNRTLEAITHSSQASGNVFYATFDRHSSDLLHAADLVSHLAG